MRVIQSIKRSLCSEAYRENRRLDTWARLLEAKVKRQEADLVALNERLMRRSSPPQPVMNAPQPASNTAT